MGNELLHQLATANSSKEIFALTRRPLGLVFPRTKNEVIVFDDLANYQPEKKCEIFICCLGTTIKQAGSQEAFRKVDFDYVLEFAKVAEREGAKKFIVVSALGANSHSSVFYNKVKGDMETAVQKLKIPEIVILEPSLLLGKRIESRPAEALTQKLSPLLNSILFGPLKKYRAIKASDVAKAIVKISERDLVLGTQVYLSDQIQEIADLGMT